MSKKFITQIKSTVPNGTAPLILDSTTVVANLNADLLDGQHGSYYAPIASPTFTGTSTFPTVSLTTTDTATAASHYIVETASDGVLRPKTLANARTEIVTTAAVNSAAATTVGTVTSGVWNAGAVTSSGAISGTTLASTVATGTAPLTITSTTKVTNLNADLIDGIDSTLIVYGSTISGSNNAAATQNLTALTQYKSGFWDVSAGSWLPNTGSWYWGLTMAHTSNSSAYLYGAQVIVENSNAGGMYVRTLQGGPTPNAGSWYQIWNSANQSTLLTSTAFTGTPTSPTATAGTNTTQIATTAFVQTAVNTTIINTQTVSYILTLGDSGEVVEMNSASANTLTVPPSGTTNFPIGTSIDIVQYGAGQTTITAGVGVTLRSSGSKLKLSGQYSAATLYKRGTDEWMIMGDLTA